MELRSPRPGGNRRQRHPHSLHCHPQGLHHRHQGQGQRCLRPDAPSGSSAISAACPAWPSAASADHFRWIGPSQPQRTDKKLLRPLPPPRGQVRSFFLPLLLPEPNYLNTQIKIQTHSLTLLHLNTTIYPFIQGFFSFSFAFRYVPRVFFFAYRVSL